MSIRAIQAQKADAFNPIYNRAIPPSGRIWRVLNAVKSVLPRPLYQIFTKYAGGLDKEAPPAHPLALPIDESSNLSALPEDKRVHVLTFLEPGDLAKLGLTSKYWNNLVADNEIWRANAARINCPVNNDSPIYSQVLSFIEDLKRQAKDIYPHDDIAQILMLKAPTIDQINYLQNWVKARDTLVVWNALVEASLEQNPAAPNLGGPGREEDNFDDRFPTAQAAINKASEFSDWCFANQVELAQLTRLDLGSKKLTSLPIEVGNLAGLQILRISNNQFSSLPIEFGNLAQLTKLGLDGNKLTSLPPWIGNLRQLKELNIGQNKLISLPSWIGNLTRLEQLHLQSNQITSLPSEIGDLDLLEVLFLADNKLTSLPVAMSKLSQLWWLDLGANRFTSLPDWIGSLNRLRQLELQSNQLTVLPSEIGNLTLLTELTLDNNQLTALPSEIGNLTLLTELTLNNNLLTALPDEMGNLTQLHRLYLKQNKLTSLPNSIGNLTLLERLGLSQNKLTSLPNSIGNLTQLITLDLAYNQITSLPKEISNLTRVQWLIIGNNPLPLRFRVAHFIKNNVGKSVATGIAALACGIYYRETLINALADGVNSLAGYLLRGN